MSPEDLIICRCEEVTLKEIVEAIENGCTTVDEIKRVTRAGMGPCQGRTCFRLVQRILAEHRGLEAREILPMTVQFPVRPVRLASIVATEILEETADASSAFGDETQ